MSPLILIYLFVLHFVADFLLQSREMGKKKSEVFSILLQHLAIQFGVVLAGLLLVMTPAQAALLSGLNALIHGFIDWNIWRFYKRFTMAQIAKGKRNGLLQGADPQGNTYRFWEDHWFFATIGLDQLLHISTIVLVYYWVAS